MDMHPNQIPNGYAQSKSSTRAKLQYGEKY